MNSKTLFSNKAKSEAIVCSTPTPSQTLWTFAAIKEHFMGLLNNMFGNSINAQEKLPNSDNEPEHAVIVRFAYGIQGLQALYELEDKLEHIMTQAAVGEYDGHEMATDYSDGLLYLYGPNAESLFKAVQPTLSTTHFMKGAIAKLRFGPPEDGVKEIDVAI